MTDKQTRLDRYHDDAFWCALQDAADKAYLERIAAGQRNAWSEIEAHQQTPEYMRQSMNAPLHTANSDGSNRHIAQDRLTFWLLCAWSAVSVVAFVWALINYLAHK